jgi:hypothetical protein
VSGMYGERSIDGGWRAYDRRPYRSGREDISQKKGAKTNGLDNTTQRRNGNDYGNEQDRTLEGRATS